MCCGVLVENTSTHAPPLTPALSPECEGEGGSFFYFFCSFAHESLSVTARLKASFPGALSGSTLK